MGTLLRLDLHLALLFIGTGGWVEQVKISKGILSPRLMSTACLLGVCAKQSWYILCPMKTTDPYNWHLELAIGSTGPLVVAQR